MDKDKGRGPHKGLATRRSGSDAGLGSARHAHPSFARSAHPRAPRPAPPRYANNLSAFVFLIPTTAVLSIHCSRPSTTHAKPTIVSPVFVSRRRLCLRCAFLPLLSSSFCLSTHKAKSFCLSPKRCKNGTATRGRGTHARGRPCIPECGAGPCVSAAGYVQDREVLFISILPGCIPSHLRALSRDSFPTHHAACHAMPGAT